MTEEKSPGYYLLKQVRTLAERSADHNFAAAFSSLDGYMRAGGLTPEQWDPDVPRPGRPPLEDGIILEDVVHGTYNAGEETLVFLAILIIPALWNLMKAVRHRLNQDKDDTHDIEVDDETPLADSPYSLGVAIVAVLLLRSMAEWKAGGIRRR